MPMHRVVSDGGKSHNLHYKLFGEADRSRVVHRVLFSMGLGGMSYHWEPQVEFFARQPGFSLCVYDNRGVGFSEPVPGRWTTRDMARDALSLLRHLGWQRDVHLVGLSMGGMVTQELVLLDLRRFSSLTLISTAAGGVHSVSRYAAAIPTGVQNMARSLLSNDRDAKLKAGLAVLYPQDFLEQRVYNKDKGSYETNYQRMRRTLVARGIAARSDGVPEQSRYSPLKQVFAVMTHRVSDKSLRRMSRHFGDASLVITGNSDALVHHSNAYALRDGLGATLMVLEQAGHGANEQCVDDVNDAILKNILRGNKSASARRR